MSFMDALIKAIDLCGGTQASLARRITENLPDGAKPVTPQHIWNWLHRDHAVPSDYCPTIEKICDGQVRCEQLNGVADWTYLRVAKKSVKAPIRA